MIFIVMYKICMILLLILLFEFISINGFDFLVLSFEFVVLISKFVVLNLDYNYDYGYC